MNGWWGGVKVAEARARIHCHGCAADRDVNDPFGLARTAQHGAHFCLQVGRIGRVSAKVERLAAGARFEGGQGARRGTTSTGIPGSGDTLMPWLSPYVKFCGLLSRAVEKGEDSPA